MTSGLVDQAGLVDQHAGRPALLRNLETLVDLTRWSTSGLRCWSLGYSEMV